MYSIDLGESSKMTCKGISKSAVRQMTHSDYRDCLFNETVTYVNMKIDSIS